MADIISYKFSGNETNTATLSFTADLPDEYQDGDLLIAFFYRRAEDSIPFQISSGWTKIPFNTAPDIHWSGQVEQYYHVVNGPVIPPTITAQNTSFTTVFVVAIRGADTTNPVVYCDSVRQNINAPTPTLTTTNNLILRVAPYTNFQMLYPDNATDTTYKFSILGHRYSGNYAQSITAWSDHQQDVGTVRSMVLNTAPSANIVLVVRSNGVSVPTGLAADNIQNVLVNYSNTGVDGGFTAITTEATSLLVPTVLGQTVNDLSNPGYGNGGHKYKYSYSDWQTRTLNAVNAITFNFGGAVLDISNGKTFNWFAIDNRDDLFLQTIFNGGIGIFVILHDTVGNWAVYGGINRGEVKPRYVIKPHYQIIIDPSTAQVLESSTTLPNLTSIAKISMGYHKGGVDSYEYVWGQLFIQNDLPVFVGGSSVSPLDIKKLNRLFYGIPHESVYIQGERQFYLTRGLQLGDGVQKTYVNFTNQVLEFVKLPEKQTQVSSSFLTMRLTPSSTDTFDITQCLITGAKNWHFIIGNSNGVINLANTLILDSDTVTLNSSVGSTIGLTIDNYASLSLNGASIDRATISNSRGTEGVLIASQAEYEAITNCILSGHQTAIKILGDQIGIWSDTKNTFANNVVDIEYTGNTDFSIQSANPVNVVNSGTGILTIISPSPVVTITGHPVGANIVVYDLDNADPQNKGTELLRVSNSQGNEQLLASSGNSIMINMYMTGYKVFKLRYTVPQTDSIVTIRPEQETN